MFTPIERVFNVFVLVHHCLLDFSYSLRDGISSFLHPKLKLFFGEVFFRDVQLLELNLEFVLQPLLVLSQFLHRPVRHQILMSQTVLHCQNNDATYDQVEETRQHKPEGVFG